MGLLTIFSCLVALFLARWFTLLRRSLQAAKKTGLPYTCRPLYEGVLAYLLWMPILDYLIDYLSDWLATILDPSDYASIYRSWRFKAGYENHRVLGDVFLVVSPGPLVLEVADPHVCAQITDRRMDFVKDFDTYLPLRILGRNIVEAEGETWKRHRRAVTPQYTDAIHAFVWDQATIIGREMLSEWKHLEGADTPIKAPYTSRESRDLGTLANRVVMAAVFGVSLSLRTGKSPEALALSEFARSMEVINAGLLFVMIFPQLVMPYVPGIGHLSKAMNHVNLYMKNILDLHINAKDKPESSAKAGILDGLLKVLAPPGTVPTEDQLSRSDVAGNMFALAFAASTTSAETMHFSMVLLALYPKVQLWVMEELDQLAVEYGQLNEGWKYQNVFPKLIRLSCVLMETLRLFPAVPMIPKCVEDRPQILSYKNSTFALPPHTLIALSACALHRNPKVWGADAGEFRPERWLADNGKSLRPEPVEGCFIGFSRGTRRCLGRRFAEAEYAAVLSEVLRNCRIELAPQKPGETVKEMSLRARKVLEMSRTGFTLRVGGKVMLRFVDRF